MENDNVKTESLLRIAGRNFLAGSCYSAGKWGVMLIFVLGALLFTYNKFVDPVLSAPGNAVHSVSEGLKNKGCNLNPWCGTHDGKRMWNSENPVIIAEKDAEAKAEAEKAANDDGKSVFSCPSFICDKGEDHQAELTTEVTQPVVETIPAPLTAPGKPTIEFVEVPEEPGVVDEDEEYVIKKRDISEYLRKIQSQPQPEVEPEPGFFQEKWENRPSIFGGKKTEE